MRRTPLLALAAAAILLPGCANDPPVADFTLSPNPTTGQRVTFDASASTPGRDEADQPLAMSKYEWDLDGNGTYERTTTTPTITREYEGTGTVEVSLRVTNVRNQQAATARTITTTPAETAAAPSSTCAASMTNASACGAGPLESNFEEEPAAAREPNYSQDPVFRHHFGNFVAPGSKERVAVATGADRLYVLRQDGDWAFVTVYDASSLQQLRQVQVQSGARDIAFYRGEVFVLDQNGKFHVLDQNGDLKRTTAPAPGAFGLAEELAFSNVTVAWKEIWSTFSLGNKQGSGVLVRDSATGAVKSLLVHRARSECKLTLHAPDGGESCVSSDSATWGSMTWSATDTAGISALPEMGALVSQCRAIERRNILGFTTGTDSAVLNDASTPAIVPECFGAGARGYFMGTESVWGQRRFLQVVKWLSGGEDEDVIVEYEVSARDTTGHPELAAADEVSGRLRLSERRAWTPTDATSGNYRDIAYRPRETKVDWSGVLTNDPTDWLRSPNNTEDKCLHYLVSDADIYVVGQRGERWYDPATGINRVDLLVDGVTVKSGTLPEGDFCINTRNFASGTHRLEVRAHLDNWSRTVSAVNERLRIDNTAPRGELFEAEVNVHGTVRYEGTMADDHAGARAWALEVQQMGQSVWREVCSGQPVSGTDRWACSWNSADGGYPDGRYRIRARMLDAAGEGGNTGHSAVWEPVTVRNTMAWDETNYDTVTNETDGSEPGLPETFFETPVADDAPDNSGANEHGDAVAYACGANDPYTATLAAIFGGGADGQIQGSATQEAELALFTGLPTMPHIPMAMLSKHHESSDHALWIARENNAIVASIRLDRLEDGTWLADEASGCSTFLSRWSTPALDTPETGVAPVDDAKGTVLSNTAGVP